MVVRLPTEKVNEIGDDQDQGLIPNDHIVVNDHNEAEDGQGVANTVTGQGTPVQLIVVAKGGQEETAAGWHCQDIEDSRTHNCAHPDFTARHKSAHKIHEQFGTGDNGRHHGGCNHIGI